MRDVGNHIGGNSLGRLFGVEPVKSRTGTLLRRDRDTKDGEMTEETTSDNESHSFRKNVLSEVKARAGRAGRKFGDNLG